MRTALRRLLVLDDDPTGSQCVHGVPVAFAHASGPILEALQLPGSTCFVLTNSRALGESEAVAATRRVLDGVLSEGPDRLPPPGLHVVSRSDSTLRGHVIAEPHAIADALEASGCRVDGFLFCPAMIEAGRVTVHDVHLADVGGTVLPVAETEFARDATFGYRHSDLREFLEERSSGAVRAADVLSVSLADIREGGVDRVVEILSVAHDRRWIVVNATRYPDMDVVAKAVARLENRGRVFVTRCGPSFVRSLAGQSEAKVLDASDIRIGGRPHAGHGLVVVGSHTELTTRQLEVLRSRGGFSELELDVDRLIDGTDREHSLDTAAAAIRDALDHGDCIVSTSRELVSGANRSDSLAIAGVVSDAVAQVVAEVRSARPAWIVAKGGITSHEVAQQGLGIRLATVDGQFAPGQISLFTPVDAPEDVLGRPYVVFPGNVGGDDALADVVDRIRTAAQAPASQSIDVGWIGLGSMGAPMALAVARAGHRVTAFDVSPTARESVSSRVSCATTAGGAAAGADVVAIMVATAAQLDSALFGDDGIAETLAPGAIVLVMSTVGPGAVEAAAARLHAIGARTVDAPVSGGVARAKTGDLLMMVSGDDADIETVRPLLDAMAGNAHTVGSRPGDGQRFKIVNQLLCGVHIAAAGEALALADAMGLDVAQCHRVLGDGAAASFMFDDRGRRMVERSFDDPASALDIFVKDMGLVTDAAARVGQPVPLAAAAEQLYALGHREGLGGKDDSVVYELLRLP